MRHGSRLRVGVVVATVVAAGVLASEAWAPPRYADLRVAVSAAPAAPSAGQVVVFTVRVHNAGPDSALETMLRYRVDGADVVRAVATQGTCAAGACALGLMGYRNAAHDARATVRLLVRAAEPRGIDVEAAASSASLAMEIEPDNTSAHASVSVVPYARPRPAADLALALVSLRRPARDEPRAGRRICRRRGRHEDRRPATGRRAVDPRALPPRRPLRGRRSRRDCGREQRERPRRVPREVGPRRGPTRRRGGSRLSRRPRTRRRRRPRGSRS